MKIEVLFALKQTAAIALRDSLFDEYGNRARDDLLTDAQAEKIRDNISGYWKIPDIAGTNYYVISILVPDVNPIEGDKTSGLTWVELMLEKWPNQVIIIGAWNADGSQYGWTVSKEDAGNMVWDAVHQFWHTVDNAVYPLHAQYMKIMPDVDGLPAVVPTEVITYLGREKRIWL